MVTWTVNYYFGQEQPDGGQPDGPDGFFRVFDTYVTVTPTAALTLRPRRQLRDQRGQRADDPSLSLQGIGAYARYQVSDAAALALRYERLDDEGSSVESTRCCTRSPLTAEYKFADGFLVRGEFRRDWSNEAFFPGRGAGDLRGHQNTR